MGQLRRINFEQLANLRLVKDYLRAFRKATGVEVTLERPDEGPEMRMVLHPREDGRCPFYAEHGIPRAACRRHSQADVPRHGKKNLRGSDECLAELRLLRAPVTAGGRQIATCVGWQVFCKNFKPPRVQRSDGASAPGAVSKQTWKAVPPGLISPARKFRAIRRLLTLFARHLGEYAERLAVCEAVCRPVSEARATPPGFGCLLETASFSPRIVERSRRHSGGR